MDALYQHPSVPLTLKRRDTTVIQVLPTPFIWRTVQAITAGTSKVLGEPFLG
jgi:hypothetical protein